MLSSSLDDLSTASELLLELFDRYEGPGTTQVLGGQAALAAEIDTDVVFAPTDIRERIQMEASVQTDADEAFASTVLIPAPPDRDLLRRQLLVAARSLAGGGRVLLCGANAEGGKSAVKDATDLFGKPLWGGYREKHRMAVFQPTEVLSPAWSKEPGIALDTWREFVVSTPAGEIQLGTQAGVFAGARLDAGTKLLLEHLEIEPDAEVLDVGCGAGIIGIFAALRGARVTMTDANLLAVEAAAHNIRKTGIDANVVASDVYQQLDPAAKFDLIVSNPPFHRGKQVDYTVANEIIEGAAERLHPDGSLVIVANAFLAYGKQMSSVFTRVDTIAATPQYHVLKATKS